MQRIIVGSNLFEAVFEDYADISFIENRIIECVRAGAGWLLLDHPDEAGTQTKVLLTPGIQVAVIRKQGLPLESNPHYQSSWIYHNSSKP